jgi:membrane-associated protease RseP (regulator of RpoE activity)
LADDQTPDENTEPAPAAPVPATPPVEFVPVDSAPTDSAPAEPVAAEPATESAASTSSARGWIWGAAAVVVVIGLLVGAYFVGRSSVDEGPASLAEAAQQTAKGDLPVGDLSLGDITSALGKNGNDILGGKSGSGNDLVDGLLNKLGKELQQQLEDGLKNGFGSDKSSGSTTTPAAQAFLGVATANAPGGAGASVTAVKAGSPAADAGLQQGDVITAVDGKAVTSAAALATQVQAHSPGDVVAITYSRNGTSAEARVRLGNTNAPTTTTTPTI